MTTRTNAAVTTAPLDFLHSARVTQWDYPRTVTRAQADDYATSLARAGVNLLLTEGHRSLVNDWPSKAADIAEIARAGGAEVSVRATKIVTDACHARGIRVVHHITSTFCTEAYLKQHEAWAQRDARTGKPVYFDQYGGLWLLCPNNPEWREYFFGLAADFTRRTGVDGWMVDEVEYLPDWYSCGCKHCRDKFRRETGHELPTGPDSPAWENFDSPVWRAWLRFRKKSGGDFFADLKRRLDAVAPAQVLTGCVAGASEAFLPQYWGMDAADLAVAGNFPFYECWLGKGLPLAGWRRCIAEMRLYAALARPHGTPALTLFYPASRAEIPACWAMTAVAGNRFWAMNPGAPSVAAHQSYAPEQGFFAWERDHADLAGPQQPLADVALLFPRQTRDAMATRAGAPLAEFAVTPRHEVGGHDLAASVNEWAGWAEVLSAGNVPFDVIREADLATLEPKAAAPNGASYRVLILPAAACLSDAQAGAVLEFAKNGGKVITTGSPASRDETGAVRADDTPARRIREIATHLDDSPGSASLLGFQFCERPFADPRDPRAVALLRDTVRGALGDPSWSVGAPEGVVAGAFRRPDGTVLVHLLNATGAAETTGTVVPGDGSYKPRFPQVKDVVVRLRRDRFAELRHAEWFAYDRHPATPLEVKPDGAYWTVTVPALDMFGAVRLRP